MNGGRRPAAPSRVASRFAVVALVLAAVILIFAARLAPYLEYGWRVAAATVRRFL